MSNTSISPYVAALLSDAAYTNVGTPATTAGGGTISLSTYDWTDVTSSIQAQIPNQPNYSDITPDGFSNEFRVFENTGTKQIVIAFKGTSTVSNLGSDLNLADEGYSAYMSIEADAQAYYNYIETQMGAGGAYAGYTVYTDGHSLGGGMAQEFAVQNDLSGFGQNSLPIAPTFISNYSQIVQGQSFATALALDQANQTFNETNVAGDIATFTYSAVLHGTYINTQPTTISSKYPAIEAAGVALALVPGFQVLGTAIAFSAGVNAHSLSTLESLIAEPSNANTATNNPSMEVSQNGGYGESVTPSGFSLTSDDNNNLLFQSDGPDYYDETTSADGSTLTIAETGQSNADITISGDDSGNATISGTDDNGGITITGNIQADGSDNFSSTNISTGVTTSEYLNADGSSGTSTMYADGSGQSEAIAVGGATSTTTYGAGGTVTGISTMNVDGSSSGTDFFSDGSVSSSEIANVDGSVSTTSYYQGGVEESALVINADGSESSTRYYQDGSISSQSNLNADGSGSITEFFDNGPISNKTITNVDGSSNSTTYYSNGNPDEVSIMNADGSGSVTDFSDNGPISNKTITNVDGSATSTSYYSDGNPAEISITNADGSDSETDYADNGNIAGFSITDTSGNTTETYYNEDGSTSVYSWSKSLISNEGGITTTYYGNGNVSSIVDDDLGVISTANYLADGKLISGYTSFDPTGTIEGDNSIGTETVNTFTYGKTSSSVITSSDGSVETTNYSADGMRTSESIVSPDLTENETFYANGNVATENYNNILNSISDAETFYANGNVESENYNLTLDLDDYSETYYANGNHDISLITESTDLGDTVENDSFYGNGQPISMFGEYTSGVQEGSSGYDEYNVFGQETSDNWTLPDGTYGSDTFNADGSSSGSSYNPDGSYSTYTEDSFGNVITTGYDVNGNITSPTLVTQNGVVAANVLDVFLTGSSDLSVTGNTLNDMITGNSGNDTLIAGSGNDTLIGGIGIDTLIGSSGNDTFVVNNVGDVVQAGSGNDTIQTKISYTVVGNVQTLADIGNGSITLTGNANGTTLVSGIGIDTLVGGSGNDTFVVNNVGDVVQALAGNNTIQTSVNYTASNNVQNLTDTGVGAVVLTGNALNDVITDNGGKDTLVSGTGDDTLVGGDTTNYLFSEGIDNTIYLINAGAGNTTIEQTSSSDTLDFGAGITADSVRASSAFVNGATVVTLQVAGGNSVEIDNPAFTTVSFSDGSTTTLNTLLTESTVNSAVSTVMPAGTITLTLTGSSNISGTGNNLGDTITANSGNDTLIAGSGLATLVGGVGNDTFVVNNVDDVVMVLPYGINTVQSSVSYTLGMVSGSGYATSNPQYLTGIGTGDLSLTGDFQTNVITANSGNDTLIAGSGNDMLVSGTGDDVLARGVGTDTFVVGAQGWSVIYDIGANGRVGQVDEEYRVSIKAPKQPPSQLPQDTISFDAGISAGQLQFTWGTYEDGADVLRQTLNISWGNDSGIRVVIPNSGDEAGSGTEQFQFADGTIMTMAQMLALAPPKPTTFGAGPTLATLLANQIFNGQQPFSYVIPQHTFLDDATVDNVTYAVTLADGSALPSWLTFNPTTNTLSSTAATTSYGTYDVNVIATDANGLSASTSFNITVTNGATSITSAVSTVMAAGITDLILTGSANVSGTGNNLNDTITGNSGADTLIAGSGIATLVGGSGNDTFVVNNAGDVVQALAGNNTIETTTSYTAASNVQTLTDIGSGGITLTGNNLNDTITGNTGADTLVAGSGNDTFVIGNAADVITLGAANAGDAVLSSVSYTLGNNLQNLTGTGTGNLTLTGNNFADVITANSGNDTLIAGSGPATLVGGSGNDTFVIDNTDDVVTAQAGSGINTVQSSVSYTLGANQQNLTGIGSSNVTLTGNNLVNIITGNSGDDTLVAGSGVASLIGNSGNDTFVVDNTGDTVSELGLTGASTVLTSVNYVLPTTVQSLTATGSAALTLTGNNQNDVLTGNAGADTLVAGSGNDSLISGSGINMLVGGSGNDTFVVNNTGDVITEAANTGNNTEQTSVSIKLAANLQNLTGIGSDDLRLTGNDLTNIITANSGTDILTAGSGLAILVGGSGNDTFVINNALDVITEAANTGNNTEKTSVSTTLAANVQNLTGTDSAALTLTGNNLNDVITGNRGNDTLVAGSGNDTLVAGTGIATLVGGSGNDTFVINNASDIITEAANTGNNTEQTLVSTTLAANVQNLIGTDSTALTLTGNNLNDVITGNRGSDTLVAGSGNDILVAGTGIATLVGGSGNDTFVINSASDVITEAANTDNNTEQTSVSTTLAANVQNLIGTGSAALTLIDNGQEADTLTANSGKDTLIAGAGIDTLVGGSGNDTFVINNASDVITEAANTGSNIEQASVSATLAANVQNLTGTGSANLALTGNNLANVITANSGNDTLIAGSGPATLVGGAGNDTFVINSASDVITEAVNSGNNTEQTSVSATLATNLQNLADIGSTALTLTGNKLTNVITAGSANDTLVAGSGLATLVGGSGNDTFVINNANDVITEAANSGNNTEQTSVSTTLVANVQNLVGTGNAALTLTDNNQTGDSITANNGKDTLVSGSGVDTLVSGAGNDTFVVNNVSDVITLGNSNTGDTAQSSVNYVLPANLLNIIGIGSSNLTFTGNAQGDTITANTGNDTLVSGSGIDTLLGGTGNDNFVINNSSDVITVASSNPADTVQSTVNYVLPTNLLNLSGIGSAAITLTGNKLADTLIANSGDDTLTAGSGVATLVGGAGNDIFNVNNIADVVTAQSDSGVNSINSSVSYTASTNVQDLTLTGNAALTATGNSGNDLIIGNNGADALVGGSGANVLEAGAKASSLTDTSGAGVLVAGAGKDTLTGGSGADFIVGGAGSDAITLGAGTAVVAFNTGDGAATIAAGTGLSNVLSLGGGIDYSDLSFSKSGNNLILNTGGNNAITFTNWYAGSADQNFVTLQVIEQAASTYSATSTNALYNDDVEEFSFMQLVTAFNVALAATPTLSSWSLTNSLLTAHLSGSNTTAMGGDLGYYAGMNGNLTGMNLATAVSTLQSTSFGNTAQNIDAWNGISNGAANSKLQ